MKEFRVYPIDAILDGTDEGVEIDSFYAKTLNEAFVKAYEENGSCAVRWIRKNENMGVADYNVTEIEYQKAKAKLKK